MRERRCFASRAWDDTFEFPEWNSFSGHSYPFFALLSSVETWLCLIEIKFNLLLPNSRTSYESLTWVGILFLAFFLHLPLRGDMNYRFCSHQLRRKWPGATGCYPPLIRFFRRKETLSLLSCFCVRINFDHFGRLCVWAKPANLSSVSREQKVDVFMSPRSEGAQVWSEGEKDSKSCEISGFGPEARRRRQKWTFSGFNFVGGRLDR